MARPRGGNRPRGAGPSNQAIAQRFALGLVTLRVIEAVTAIVVLAMLVYGVMTQQYLFALPVVITGLVYLAKTVLGIRMQRQMAKEKAGRKGPSFADLVLAAQREAEYKEGEYWLDQYSKNNLDAAARKASSNVRDLAPL